MCHLCCFFTSHSVRSRVHLVALRPSPERAKGQIELGRHSESLLGTTGRASFDLQSSLCAPPTIFTSLVDAMATTISLLARPLSIAPAYRARRRVHAASRSIDRYDASTNQVVVARAGPRSSSSSEVRASKYERNGRTRSITRSERETVRRRERTITRASSSAGFAGTPPNRAPNPAALVEKFTSGIKDRLESDPNFLFKLGAEIVIDFCITMVVNLSVRGNPSTWALAATLAVMCQCITAIINDTLLVYFLAPRKGEVGKAEEIANVFAKGDYSLAQRFGCYLKKGKFYATIGSISMVVSMYLALVLAGNASGFTREVFFRSIACGALHMGISSNTRYQLVNGIERMAYDILPTNVAKATSVSVRMGNNFLGARLWMVVATMTGIS